MTEHPNYKYRPRRRKHNKQRTTSGVGPRVGTSLPSPNVPNMSPRYSGYIPNSSLSPTIQQTNNYGTMDFPSPGATSDYGQSGEKRYSPVNFQNKYQYNYSVGYQQNYGQKSPFSLHTPDQSPTHSPEPKTVSKQPKSPQENKENSNETDGVLPTPDLSPLEQEYDDKQRISNIQHTSNVNNLTPNNLSPTQQNYRVQTYRQPNTISYTNTQPITSVPMANGMYVMCANKSSVEQGHVVTGTFYPPVATSQDQQLLGTSQNNLNSVANSANTVHYYSNNLQQYYATKDYYKDEILMNPQMKTDYVSYSIKNDVIMDKGEYDLSYKGSMGEYPPYPLVQGFMQHGEERSDVESDVDAREFDKYLKYNNSDPSVIDSNHNYHRSDSLSSNVTYNFQAQHTSVILPNTNVKPEPQIGHYADVYDIAQNGVQKNDDDFSEILADVRKTCYSN